MALKFPPDRGRIVIVNFELGGQAVPPEMCKSGRPCIVVQNNAMKRGPLVTVVPLSTKEPEEKDKWHHLMDHRSFRDLPPEWGGQGMPRWAKCDYVATVSLERCLDPYHAKTNWKPRRYVKVKIIQSDMDAVEKCIIWALGIVPEKHVTTPVVEAETEADPTP
jgi:mRNA interferase MazF